MQPKLPEGQRRVIVHPIRRTRNPLRTKTRARLKIHKGSFPLQRRVMLPPEPAYLISFKSHQVTTATMPTLDQPYILSNCRNGSPYCGRPTAHLFWRPLTFDRDRIRLVLHGILSSEILMPLRQAPRFFKGHTLRSAPLSPWTPYSYGAQFAQLFEG